MTKRILVALDPDSDTPVAVRHAAEIARRHDAEVTGLAVVDARFRGGGAGIGSMHYQEKLREHGMEEGHEKARELCAAFEVEMRTAGVRFRIATEEGVPFERIIGEMRYYDLLVVGRDAHFFYSRPEHDTHTVAHVVKEAIAPAFVVDTPYRPIRHVLVAYDGSPAASLSLQRFAQLKPFGTDPALHLLHVYGGDHAASERMLQQVAEYLKAHGFRTEGLTVHAGSPENQIIAYAEEHAIDLIVSGARFVSKIRELTSGSITTSLLKHAPASLFLEG